MLDGKVAIVTGSSRGIGRAIALNFAEHGAKVVLNHTREGKDIKDTIAALNAMEADYLVCQGSVAESGFADEMVKVAKERFERIDILVNNAGINRDRPMMLMREADWNSVVDTNLKGAFFCSKAVLRPMIDQQWGRIINITSITALGGRPGQSNYGAAKAGLIGMTKSLAREVGGYNVLVNAVVVGLIDTMMTKRLPRDIKEEMMKLIPLGRIGQPQEVANVCLFLGSELASYISGSTLNVSGGGYM